MRSRTRTYAHTHTRTPRANIVGVDQRAICSNRLDRSNAHTRTQTPARVRVKSHFTISTIEILMRRSRMHTESRSAIDAAALKIAAVLCARRARNTDINTHCARAAKPVRVAILARARRTRVCVCVYSPILIHKCTAGAGGTIKCSASERECVRVNIYPNI